MSRCAAGDAHAAPAPELSGTPPLSGQSPTLSAALRSNSAIPASSDKRTIRSGCTCNLISRRPCAAARS
eukprot:3756588-Rhodomonas_salina.1